MATGTAHKSLNVFKKPLLPFSREPMTGFKRNGSCEVPDEDTGNHSIAATVTDAFLDFTASRGNDLRRGAGLRAGQKWCLCAGRWREAMEYARSNGGTSSSPSSSLSSSSSSSSTRGQPSPSDIVPKVHLHATHERALDLIDLADLKRYAAEGEAGTASNTPQSRKGNAYPGGVKTRERTELAGKEEMTGRD